MLKEDSGVFLVDKQVSLKYLADTVLQNKLRFFSGVILGIAASAILYVIVDPVFEAEAVLYPNQDTIDQANELGGAGGSLGSLISLANADSSNNRVTKYLAVLRSRSFVVPFLIENGIIVDLIDEDSADSESQRNHEAHVRFIEDKMTVERDRISGLVKVRVRWSSPEASADLTNALVSRLNAQVREEFVGKAQQKVEYLNQALNGVNVVESRALLFNLIEQEQRKIVFATGEPEFAFEVLDAAISDETPVYPKLAVFGILGLIVGALSGLSIALLMRKSA